MTSADKGLSIDTAVTEDDPLQIAYATRRLISTTLSAGVSDREMASLTRRLIDLGREIRELRAAMEGVEEGIAGADAPKQAFDATAV